MVGMGMGAAAGEDVGEDFDEWEGVDVDVVCGWMNAVVGEWGELLLRSIGVISTSATSTVLRVCGGCATSCGCVGVTDVLDVLFIPIPIPVSVAFDVDLDEEATVVAAG